VEQAYLIGMLYKLDIFVHVGLLISLSALIVSAVVYAISSDLNHNDDSLNLSLLASDIHGIEESSKAISESCEHIENILDPNSILKNINVGNKQAFTSITIEGQLPNLSIEEKNKIERILDRITIHLLSIQESIGGVDKIVNETKNNSGMGKKFIQGLIILTAILFTLHIFLPSKDFIDKMVESNGYTVNTEAK